MKKIDKRRKQILIIECDSRTLESQSLALGTEIETRLKTAFPRNGIDLIRADNRSVFNRDLDSVLRKYKLPCKTIIIIGHSNENGIKLTSDTFAEWKEIGSMLEPFAPNQLIFLACRAGSVRACETLFELIPSLQHILASPDNIPASQLHIALFKAIQTLSRRKEKPIVLTVAQTVSAVFTKEWMFSRTRKEYENGSLHSKHFMEKGILTITDLIMKKRGF